MSNFNKSIDVFTELAPGIRRLVAPNPSMMTGPGTNTYLIGHEKIAVIDPGPRLLPHIDDICARAAAPIAWILVTHTHPDHSPAARRLAEISGAELLGRVSKHDDHQDKSFVPTRALNDGDTLTTPEFVLQALHTPGHASNHLCFLHQASNWILTGDHIIDGSTVVINPPDGSMSDYLASLRRIRALEPAALLPGHGELIDDPAAVIDWIIDHRLQREAKVLAALQAHPNLATRELVPHVYTDVSPKLFAWAERSLLAHLEKLHLDGVAINQDGRWNAS